MPSDAKECHLIGDPMHIPMPELDLGRLSLDPHFVRSMQQDRNAAQSFAPLDHGCVEMRMRDDDFSDTSARFEFGNGIVRHHAHAFPENISSVRRKEKSPLRNGEPIRDANTQEATVLLDAKLVLLHQRIVRGPLLTAPPYILAIIHTYGALERRLLRIFVLHSAGFTNVVQHFSLSGKCMLTPMAFCSVQWPRAGLDCDLHCASLEVVARFFGSEKVSMSTHKPCGTWKGCLICLESR